MYLVLSGWALVICNAGYTMMICFPFFFVFGVAVVENTWLIEDDLFPCTVRNNHVDYSLNGPDIQYPWIVHVGQ